MGIPLKHLEQKLQSCVYDAVSILGFGPASDEPLPEQKCGEIVIRYGGWSLQVLRNSAVGKELMSQHDWYDKLPWSTENLPAGIYRVRVPVPGSNRKTFVEQEQMLSAGERTASVVLVATALLAHGLQTNEDLLKRDWTRCKEQVADGCRVGLYWNSGQLRVRDITWDVDRYPHTWLSSVWTS